MTENEQHRDRPFNPYLNPTSKPSIALIMEALNQVTNYERWLAPRKRKRKELDMQKFEKTISVILSNLIYNYLSGDTLTIAITRSKQNLSKQSRYKPWYFGEQLPRILDYMAAPEMAFLSINLGEVGRQTTIQIGERLKRWINEYDLSVDDFRNSKDAETIILKRKKQDFWDQGGSIEYDDTELTNSYRIQLLHINNWLAEADISFQSKANLTPPVNVKSRQLFREFNYGRFDCGGRLFGGFWQNLKKEHRRENIFINGEATIELDFGQTYPTLMYGMVGVTPPDGDLYSLSGFEECRPAIKKVFNSLLFRTKPMTRLPYGTRELVPDEYSVQDLLGAIKAKHPDLSPLLVPSGHRLPVGYQLMFQESSILILAMERLRRLGIVALPIHDALIVPQSKVDQATMIMKEAFKDYSGVNCSISLK